MKKLLIATTALVATAGVAAAEVAVSGDGRMGVVYNGEDLNFTSRVRVAFDLSGETDGGLRFGGWFRVHEAGTTASGMTGAANGSRGYVFIEGAFGRLEMGDTVGAAEAVLGDLPSVGLTGLNDYSDLPYITGDQTLTDVNNPVALYTYATGGLTFALSLNDGRQGQTSTPDTQEYAVGVKYAFGDYSVSLAYEVSDPVAGASSKSLWLGGEATFGTTTVKAYIADGSGAISGQKSYGLGVSSTFDAVTVNAFARRDDVVGTKTDFYGIGAEYSLGGGATLAGGIAKATGVDTVADFGIKFSF